MKCPICNSEQLKVTNTRDVEYGIKRIRVCLSCGAHIPTIEVNKITDRAIKSLEKTKTIIRHKETKGRNAKL